MSDMSMPRRAAPEDDTDLADAARSWRRYLILVICGVIVAVLGLGIFGYLAWWSLCDQAAGVCQRGEPVMYWCSVVSLAILGLIIGVLTQIWLEALVAHACHRHPGCFHRRRYLFLARRLRRGVTDSTNDTGIDLRFIGS